MKEGTTQFIKGAAKQAASNSSKFVVKAANPVGIAADVIQAGCELYGYEKVGKQIGMGGNIAAGAMMGSVGGPAGAVVGALGGLLIWGAGEVVGGVIERVFSNDNQQNQQRNHQE